MLRRLRQARFLSGSGDDTLSGSDAKVQYIYWGGEDNFGIRCHVLIDSRATVGGMFHMYSDCAYELCAHFRALH